MTRVALAVLCLVALAGCSDDTAPAPAASGSSAASSSSAPAVAFSQEPARRGFTEGQPADLTLDAAAAARTANDPQLAAVEGAALSAGGFVDGHALSWTRGGDTLVVTVVELESAQDASGLLEFDRLASTNSGTAFDLPGVTDEVAVRTPRDVRVSFARGARVWMLLFSLAVDEPTIDAIVAAQASAG